MTTQEFKAQERSEFMDLLNETRGMFEDAIENDTGIKFRVVDPKPTELGSFIDLERGTLTIIKEIPEAFIGPKLDNYWIDEIGILPQIDKL